MGRPVAPAKRSFHTNVIDHCLEGLKHASTGGMRSLSYSLAQHMGYGKAIDQSKILNAVRGRKGNQQEFMEFVTSKVFVEFAPFIDPKFQKTFKNNLKNLDFEDAHALFQRFSEISERYLELESDIHRSEYKPGSSKKEDAELWQTFMDITLEELDSEMNSLIHDCMLRVAIATGKKSLQDEKKGKKLLPEKGISLDQLKVIDEIQKTYATKLSQLEALDRNSAPLKAEKLERECRDLLDELLKVLHIKPKDLAKLALTFESRNKQEGTEKLDPDKYSSTERRILIGSTASLTNYLLEFLLATVLGMVILNAVDERRDSEKQKRELFVIQMQQSCEKNMLVLGDLQGSIERWQDSNPLKPAFSAHIEEIQKIIDEQFKNIREYQTLSANQLVRTNVLSEMAKEKIDTYAGLHAWLQKNSEEVHKQGRSVEARDSQIIKRVKSLQTEYKESKRTIKIQALKLSCTHYVQNLTRFKLNATQSESLNSFNLRLSQVKDNDVNELKLIRQGLQALTLNVQETSRKIPVPVSSQAKSSRSKGTSRKPS